jgi:hypothetical protein
LDDASATKPQIYKIPPVNFTSENPANIRFKLSDYLIGPQLNYQTHTSSGIIYDLKHVDPVTIDSPQDGYRLVDTYSIDSDSYYRLSVSDKALQIDKCTGISSGDINCASAKNIGLAGRPLAYSIFQRVTID